MFHVDYSAQPAILVFLLLSGHMLADFALQTEWIATNKNPKARLRFQQDERSKLQIIWPHLLTAHAMHHALMVFLITGSLTLSLAELGVHWIIDFGKCEGWYGFHADQFAHIVSKLLWAWLVIGYGM